MVAIQNITNEHEWETFRLQCAPQAFFQSWLWGEVEIKQGLSVWRYGLYEDGLLQAIFQVVKVNARRGKHLHVRHGPIVMDNTSKIWKHIIDYLSNLARSEHCWFMRISPLVQKGSSLQHLLKSFGALPSPIHAMDGEVCWIVDLDRSLPAVLSDMRKTTRYEIRRSEKMAIDISTEADDESIAAFSDLYVKTAQRHGFVPHKGIETEIRMFVKMKKGLLFVGKFEGDVIASAFIVFDGEQAIYHHGASLPAKIPVSYALQWAALSEAHRRGMKRYNFWGIAPTNDVRHPWRGITAFKMGFGGSVAEYMHASDLPVSPLYWITYLVETIRRKLRHY